jgi:hypothetical protein
MSKLPANTQAKRVVQLSRHAAIVALFALGAAHCATTRPTLGVSTVDRLAQLSQSPLARQVQRDAPDAYAQFAVAIAGAEQATGVDRDYKIREAELTLAWAATQGRVRQAQARQQLAQQQTQRDHDEQARLDEQIARLDRESEERENAANSLVIATSTAPGVGAAQAAELRQQARLALAAATLIGASATQLEAARALLAQAEAAPAASALAASGRAFAVASELVRTARRVGTEASDERVLQSLAGGEVSVDPRPDPRGVVLSLRGLFDARGGLNATAQGRLAVIVQSLQNHRQLRARVEAFHGGSDAATAQRTAQDRARVVRDALVARGVDGARIEAEGVARVADGTRAEDVVEVVLLTNG